MNAKLKEARRQWLATLPHPLDESPAAKRFQAMIEYYMIVDVKRWEARELRRIVESQCFPEPQHCQIFCPDCGCDPSQVHVTM